MAVSDMWGQRVLGVGDTNVVHRRVLVRVVSLNTGTLLSSPQSGLDAVACAKGPKQLER